MVQANPGLKSELAAMFAQVSFQSLPDPSSWGKPAAVNQAVEELKKAKGKPMSDNSKQLPASVKAIAQRVQANDLDNGFEGAKFENKRTGKAKQHYTDGSWFDGFMLHDELVKGRFYFANGDFYQGTFTNNQMTTG